jgi:hypothetical protein
MSKRPNLFIVGAPKCGTTAWYEYLGTHPDIFLPELKEPHYFCADFPEKCRVDGRRGYFDLFAPAKTEKVIGEASASYLYSKLAARNIRAFATDARIIIFVRERAALLVSWHNQLLENGIENRGDFEEAWRLSGNRAPDDHGHLCNEKSFLDYRAFGYLNEQVERFFEAFPAEQIRVFDFDDWRRDPRSTYVEIMRFLGLRDDGRSEFGRVNEARASRWKSLRLFLRQPPRPLAALYHRTRAVTGIDAAPVGRLLMRLNSNSGYRGGISDRLRREIQALYAEDDAKLQPRIWRSAANREASA